VALADGRSRNLLRNIVAALILVPLAIVIAAFAVANRQSVTVSLDPLGGNPPAASVTWPLFALVIVLLVVGVLIGGMTTWLGQGKWRRRARRLQRELSGLHRDVASRPSASPTGVTPASEPPPRLRLKAPVQ